MLCLEITKVTFPVCTSLNLLELAIFQLSDNFKWYWGMGILLWGIAYWMKTGYIYYTIYITYYIYFIYIIYNYITLLYTLYYILYIHIILYIYIFYMKTCSNIFFVVLWKICGWQIELTKEFYPLLQVRRKFSHFFILRCAFFILLLSQDVKMYKKLQWDMWKIAT